MRHISDIPSAGSPAKRQLPPGTRVPLNKHPELALVRRGTSGLARSERQFLECASL